MAEIRINRGTGLNYTAHPALPAAGKIQIAALRREHAPNVQRAFLMCKPDAVSRQIAPDIIKDISSKLSERYVSHRIVAPKLFKMSQQTADEFYRDLKPEIRERVAPFIAGSHPDPRVPQVPVFTFIIEAHMKAGENLIDILRSDNLIGPTYISEKTMADPIKAENTRKSVRYKYTLGAGILQKPFEDGPVMNCVHCSSSPEDAGREISLIYTKDELAPYYEGDTFASIYKSSVWVRRIKDPKEISIPLQTITSAAKDKSLRKLMPVIANASLRDTDRNTASFIYDAAQKIMQITSDTGRLFCNKVFAVQQAPLKPKTYLKNVICLSGYSGSGKSTIESALVKKFNLERLVLYTTRPPRDGEVDGRDYHFLNEEKFEELMQNGEIVACEEGHGIVYGISRRSLEEALIGKKDIILVGGPNIANDIRRYLHITGTLNRSVTYSSVFITLPGQDPIQKAELMSSHIDQRTDAETRKKDSTPESIYSFESYSSKYDLVVENKEGDLKGTISAVSKHVEGLDSSHITTFEDSKSKTIHWDKVMVGTRLKILSRRLTGFAHELANKNLDVIESNILSITDEMMAFFNAFKNTRIYSEEAALSTAPLQDPILPSSNLTKHMQAVLAAHFQLNTDYLTIRHSTRRIGRLALLNEPKFIRNSSVMKAMSRTINEESKLYLALMHDIGKTIKYPLHPEYSYDLCNKLTLHRWFQFTEEEAKLNNLVILYHTILGAYMEGNQSYAEFHAMLSNPKVRAILCTKDGKVNLFAVQQFLDRLLYLSFIDVAGSGDEAGALNNTKVEIYYNTISNLFEGLKENRDSYDHALDEIKKDIPNHTLKRIGLFIGFSDTFMDSHPNALGKYTNLVQERAKAAISKGVMTQEQWEKVLGNFHLINNIPYGLFNCIARVNAQGTEPLIKGFNPNFNDSIFRLLITISTILDKYISTDAYTELRFTDANGHVISNRGKGDHLAAIKMNNIFMNASGNITNESDKHCLVDKDGSAIPGIEISIIENIKEKSIIEDTREKNIITIRLTDPVESTF